MAMGSGFGGGSYELVDNGKFGKHRDALGWLGSHYGNTLNVATGYVSLEGLDALARVAGGRAEGTRLLIGSAPSSEDLVGREVETVRSRFERSRQALRRERDFSAFPASRRAVLERVAEFVGSGDVETRRYHLGFLHGKAYILGEFGDRTVGAGAALVSSANLTRGGLAQNLELGMVHYQPNVVRMALEWYEGLWEESVDFREGLLELLRPPSLEVDARTVFLRALLELYEGDLGGEERGDVGGGGGLVEFQRDGFVRAKRILNRYGGVLYADGVGMGKTEIGIEFVREYTRELGLHALIISPAQLRDRLWEQRLSEANLAGDVVSYQELAQDRQLGGGRRVLRVDKDVYRLVVIDEAHAYRNVGNTWYAALDRLMGGTSKKLLLLTATPVNNSLWDLHNLFLLFGRHDSAFSGKPLRIPSLGRFFKREMSRTGETSGERLFPLIDALTVRRDRAFVMKHYPGTKFADGTVVKFPEPELRERRYDLDSAHPGIVQAVHDGIEHLTMARYRQSAYRLDGVGESASEEALAGLIRSQLLKRFESSWHAALETVKRMHDGNERALLAVESGGAAPVADAVRDLGGDSGEDDSGLSADLVEEAMSSGGAGGGEVSGRFLEDLGRDRGVLGELLASLESLRGARDPKLEALGEIMGSTRSKKVAIFTAFQDTASYLRGEFERDPGLLGGRSWTAAIGSSMDASDRMRELERFCPESVSGEEGRVPERGEVDVLLSTDILSEGQNLQQAQAVVSFDMPWNPQRVVQRNGRIIRLRSPHDAAYLYTMLPKRGDLDRLLRLEARLQAKVRAANASVGMESQVLEGVEAESQVYADLAGFVERLAGGDASLLEEGEVVGGEGGSGFEGEDFRLRLRRAAEEGELGRLRGLPWGVGSALARRSGGMSEAGVFFACRTRGGDRYWRMVSVSGKVTHREDLPMLRLIDPGEEQGVPIPGDIDLEGLFGVAAADICAAHNAMLDPEARFGSLPAVQRWALDVLRCASAPGGREFDEADAALSAGRGNLARRALSEVRREHEGGGMSVGECARRIVGVAREFGLRAVESAPAPERITEGDLGVVCYQVVLPAGGG